jgi:hypothetical protein
LLFFSSSAAAPAAWWSALQLERALQQSDQIGQSFAQWLVAYFAQLFEKYTSSPHFWDAFFHG